MKNTISRQKFNNIREIKIHQNKRRNGEKEKRGPRKKEKRTCGEKRRGNEDVKRREAERKGENKRE